MPDLEYFAIIESRAGAFSLYFPDLPGCTSAGDSLEDVVEHGTQALKTCLELLAARGIAAPQPSSAAMVRSQADSIPRPGWSVQIERIAVVERVCDLAQ